MARSPNSRCDFDNGFFTCNLPEDAVLLVVKVKTKTGNHTLVEDTEKQTEKFRPWKKPTKDGKTSPRKLPGVLSHRKNDNGMTLDSGPCPSSLTETEYKPQFFDEPECLSSDKEKIPPVESITPPSLKNLSLKEGMTGNETEAMSCEASVAKIIMTTARASSPYPDQPSTLEQLEPDMDDDIIDITDYSERPSNEKRSPQHKQKYVTHTVTQEHCSTPQTSPTYIAMNTAAAPAKPCWMEIWGILLDKTRTLHGWPACLKKQPPRVAFRNNDIHMINDEESNLYKEPWERNMRVLYKLMINKDPTSKNMPHEEEFDDDNYESIEEKETAVWRPPPMTYKFFAYDILYVNIYSLKCRKTYCIFYILDINTNCCKNMMWLYTLKFKASIPEHSKATPSKDNKI